MKTLEDKNPELISIINKNIPGIFGSQRSYWVKGYVGIKIKTIKGSATELFYKMGRDQAKKDNFIFKGKY